MILIWMIKNYSHLELIGNKKNNKNFKTGSNSLDYEMNDMNVTK